MISIEVVRPERPPFVAASKVRHEVVTARVRGARYETGDRDGHQRSYLDSCLDLMQPSQYSA